MSRIVISCTDQELEIQEANLVASGGVNEDTVAFQFCPKWDGFVKTAVFYQNKNEVYHQLLENDCCAIPWEVLTKRGTVYIGVFGVSGGVTRTSNIVKLKVTEGAITAQTAVHDPSPDVYAQLLSRLYGVHIGNEEPTDMNTMAWVDPEGEVGGRTLLWQNTESAMAEESIEIPNLMDYDRLEIVHITDSEITAMSEIPLHQMTAIFMLNLYGRGALHERMLSISEGSLSFDIGVCNEIQSGSTNENDESCAPVAIYGIKEGWI